MTIFEIETLRQRMQKDIDAEKSIESRRGMGQFATPHDLSLQIVSETLSYLTHGKHSLRVLETSMGSGSFVSSALMKFPGMISEIRGYELDPDFYKRAVSLWEGQPVKIMQGDFTAAIPEPDFDVVFSNPPYVRHHAIAPSEKARLQSLVRKELGVRVSGLAGLYCYFLLLSYLWMKPGAVGAWLIPSEWMSVNYGSALRSFLSRTVKLLRIHRFDVDDVRFSDALVSSCVVWFKKACSDTAPVRFTFGTDMSAPRREIFVSPGSLQSSEKWPPQTNRKQSVSRLGEYFIIRRGIATGDNGYFVLPEMEAKKLKIPMQYLKPVLPSPRHLAVDRVIADEHGVPTNAKRQFLFDCTGHDESRFPDSVRNYLASGANTTGRKRLCSSRTVWYEQEQRAPTRFLCSYMGRGDGVASPVRFILNDSHAIAANSFLMLYPKDILNEALSACSGGAEEVWRILVNIPAADIKLCGRSYGGGLYKVEPKELANVPCKELATWVKSHKKWGLPLGTVEPRSNPSMNGDICAICARK